LNNGTNTNKDLGSINTNSGFQLGAAPTDKYGLNSRRRINTHEEQESEDRVVCPLCGGEPLVCTYNTSM
jgi:formate dehydrogenase maturation protein FdhE